MADSLVDKLRRKNQLQAEAARARTQQEAYQGAFQDPQFTVGGGSTRGNIGGSQFEIPAPVAVNYGDIIGKGLTNFMAARKGKEASEKEAEAQAMNAEFMQGVIGNDPQAQKLFMAAQAGLPGADKALADHIAPKKQSMAVFMQAVTSGNLDPGMAREVAPQFGIDPEMGAKAADYAFRKKQEAEDMKFGRQRELRGMSIDAAYDRQTRQLEARQPKTGSRVSIGDGLTEPNDAVQADLTPGQKQLLAKETIALDKEIGAASLQKTKYSDLRGRLESNKENFGGKQKVAKVLTEFENPILGAIGKQMRNKDMADLEEFVMGETITRMQALGGNDSNEELRRMQASLPSALNNRDTALHLMDQMEKWKEVTMEAAKMRLEALRSGATLQPGTASMDEFYAKAKKKLGWDGPNVGAGNAPKKSIDDWLDEQGVK